MVKHDSHAGFNKTRIFGRTHKVYFPAVQIPGVQTLCSLYYIQVMLSL